MVSAVQILVRERLEARCEELKSQTGNRPITLADVGEKGRTRDSGTAPIGSAGTPDMRRKNFSPSEKNRPWNGTSQFVDPTVSPQVKEALIRDLPLECERQTETGTAPFGAGAADVLVDATVGVGRAE